MDNLKPCPFCGRPVELVYEGSSDWTADCPAPCFAQITFWVRSKGDEPKEAARRWNSRPDRAEDTVLGDGAEP